MADTPLYTHIIETFLWDRPHWQMPESYLRYRLEFFREFTLRSILNQTHTDFRIFLQLGERYRKITDGVEFENVEKCHDFGQDKYSKIKTRFLVITRIDSDDLFHHKAIREVKRRIELDAKRRTVCVFKHNLCWDMINGIIAPHFKATSPFFTQVFPRPMYSKWGLFHKMHFAQHGNHGAGDRAGKELPPEMVCVLKHGQNVSLMKRNLPPFELTERQIQIMKDTNRSDYNFFAYEKALFEDEAQIDLLNKFGINRDDALLKWRDMRREYLEGSDDEE